MADYRKILVAFDGSASARNALKEAGRLAQENKSWIKVVAVVPGYKGDLDLTTIGNIEEAVKGPGREYLAEARRLAEENGVHILTDLEQGEPYERIVQVAEEENCDLIVIGRRGLSNIERELMGSVTERVIGHTKRDVLVIPENGRVAWANILLSVDGSPHSEAAVAKAIALAAEKGAKLTAAHAVFANDEFLALAPKVVDKMIEDGKALLASVQKRAQDAGVELDTAIREGEPHEVISMLAQSLPADLIVMGSHGRKGLTRLLMGSVTERVIGFAHCPVLVSHIG